MEINGDVTMETNKRIKSENRASQPFDTRTAGLSQFVSPSSEDETVNLKTTFITLE